MPKIKLDYIVSCSSEDSVHVANNLLNNDTSKKWKSKNTGEATATVIIQLEKACKISGVDIGNENSSFVEVFVGRSSSQESEYQVLLATCSFMTPMEARSQSSNNINRVRMFTTNDMATPVRDETWDRVKIVCSQPFNKHVQYGLSFVTLHTPDESKSDEAPLSLGKFTLRPKTELDFLTAGSLFARRKELAEQKEPERLTIAQEIRMSSTPEGLKKYGIPKCKAANINPSTSGTQTPVKNTDVEIKNRNRKDLFYDPEDDEPHEKIDKAMAKIRENEEKRKEEAKKATPVKTTKKKDIKTPNEKTDKRKADKQTPKDKNMNSPVPSKKIKNDATPSTSKRKINLSPKKTQKKKKLETRPFYELMSGVVFTISGIQNPERANLRQQALNMGAKYKPDWDNSCTHLICAFANTPKFQQVQGKGKIVKKTWIQDCHTERKRLPWRRYALDRNDIGKPESEDEICEKTAENENEIEIEEPQESEPEEMQTSQILNKGDTEDEIEKIIEQQRTKRNGDKTISVENNEARRDKNDKSSSNKNVKTNRDEYVSGSDTEDEVEKIIAQQKTKAENSMTENKTKKDKINSDEKTNKERGSSDKNYKINQEYVSGSDTEDEIEKIITKQKAKAGNTKTEGNKTSSDKNNKTYKEENDGNEKVKNGDNVASSSEKIDPFDMDTDEERLEKNPKDLTETIPSIFSKDLFYVDEVFTENEKNKIERLIKAFDGIVLSRVNNILDYVITNEESVDSWKEKCSSAKFVTSLWIYACHNEQQLVPIDKYTLS